MPSGRKFVVLGESRSRGKSQRRNRGDSEERETERGRERERQRDGIEGVKLRVRSGPYGAFVDRGSAIRAIKCMQSRVNFIELSGGSGAQSFPSQP